MARLALNIANFTMPSNDSQEFDQELLSAYLDNQLSEDERTRVQQRLQSDPHARQFVEELRELSLTIRQLPREGLSDSLRKRVLDAIALGDESALSTLPTEAPAMLDSRRELRGVKRGLAWATMAIAAALALMVAMPPGDDDAGRKLARSAAPEISEDRRNGESDRTILDAPSQSTSPNRAEQVVDSDAGKGSSTLLDKSNAADESLESADGFGTEFSVARESRSAQRDSLFVDEMERLDEGNDASVGLVEDPQRMTPEQFNATGESERAGSALQSTAPHEPLAPTDEQVPLATVADRAADITGTVDDAVAKLGDVESFDAGVIAVVRLNVIQRQSAEQRFHEILRANGVALDDRAEARRRAETIDVGDTDAGNTDADDGVRDSLEEQRQDEAVAIYVEATRSELNGILAACRESSDDLDRIAFEVELPRSDQSGLGRRNANETQVVDALELNPPSRSRAVQRESGSTERFAATDAQQEQTEPSELAKYLYFARPTNIADPSTASANKSWAIRITAVDADPPGAARAQLGQRQASREGIGPLAAQRSGVVVEAAPEEREFAARGGVVSQVEPSHRIGVLFVFASADASDAVESTATPTDAAR